MNTHHELEIRELTAAELDTVSGGGLVEDIYDAASLVDMAAQWIMCGAIMAMRDPWA